MNLQDFLLHHENRNVHDETPPQGLFEARRAGVFLNCLVLIRRGGDPSVAAAIIVHGRVLKKNIVS